MERKTSGLQQCGATDQRRSQNTLCRLLRERDEHSLSHQTCASSSEQQEVTASSFNKPANQVKAFRPLPTVGNDRCQSSPQAHEAQSRYSKLPFTGAKRLRRKTASSLSKDLLSCVLGRVRFEEHLQTCTTTWQSTVQAKLTWSAGACNSPIVASSHKPASRQNSSLFHCGQHLRQESLHLGIAGCRLP